MFFSCSTDSEMNLFFNTYEKWYPTTNTAMLNYNSLDRNNSSKHRYSFWDLVKVTNNSVINFSEIKKFLISRSQIEYNINVLRFQVIN